MAVRLLISILIVSWLVHSCNLPFVSIRYYISFARLAFPQQILNSPFVLMTVIALSRLDQAGINHFMWPGEFSCVHHNRLLSTVTCSPPQQTSQSFPAPAVPLQMVLKLFGTAVLQ